MRKWQNYLAISFIIVELIFLVLVCLGVGEGQTLHYVSIVICFAFSLVFISKKLSVALIQVGLLFTVISDTFLVLLNGAHKDVAMTTFAIAQIMYASLLLLKVDNKLKLVEIITRVVSLILLEIIVKVVLKDKFDYLSFISGLYYVTLILNLVFAFVSFKDVPYLAIGFVFFILCDTIIGLHVGNGY